MIMLSAPGTLGVWLTPSDAAEAPPALKIIMAAAATIPPMIFFI
jgi:hypothetical protein